VAVPSRREAEMTGKSEFSQEEWELVREGPPVAGMLVLTAQKGGSFRESFALAGAYADARKQHGESELLDALVSEKPAFDRKRYGSPEKLREEGLPRLGAAVGLLEHKATPDEIEDYRTFVLRVAAKVAEAHKEAGEKVSSTEQAAIDEVAASVGAQAS
jgi:hypothetical protein